MFRFKRSVLSFLLLAVLPCSLLAQLSEDSLRRACISGKDSLQADAWLQLGKQYFTARNNLDSLVRMSKKGLLLAEQLGNKALVYQANRQLAAGYVGKNDSAASVHYLQAAMAAALDEKDGRHVADIYQLYAAFYGNRGLTGPALACLVKEAEAAEAVHYYSAMAAAYSGMAWIYRGRGENDKRLYYHRQSLGIVSRVDPSNMGNIIQVYVSSSQGYADIGFSSDNSSLMDSARILADSALALSLRHNRVASIPSAYYVFSIYSLYKKKYAEAIAQAKAALGFRDYIDSRSKLILYSTIAISSAYLSDKITARLYLDSAYGVPAAQELYYKNHLANVDYQVSKLFGEPERALKAYELFTSTKDSLNALDRIRALAEIEQKFNKSENEKKIQQLAQEKKIAALNIRLLTAAAIGAALFALLVLFLFRQRNLRNAQERMEITQRLNRARMDPHFLFNSFTALQSYILREKDPSAAVGFLSDYAGIMRQTLESTYRELVVLEDEISYLGKYLELQQIRTPHKFSYAVKADDDVDVSGLQVPAMIIQPFAENAIEHGFAGIDYEGRLEIRFSVADEMLLITITDNGTGFARNEKEKGYPSRATGIIRDQFLLLNKKYKSNAGYTIRSNPDGPGVLVTIQLPFIP